MLIENMVRRVLVEAEGCPESLALEDMRDACIEWCERTYCLTTGLTVDTVPGDQDPGAIDMGQLITLQILSARVDGEDVDVLAANDPATQHVTEACPAIVYATPDQPVLIPAPTRPRSVELYLAVGLGPEVEELPDFVWQRYSRHLIDGALSKVLARQGKPWSNPNEAERRRQLFERAINTEAPRIGVNRVTTAQRLRVTPV